MTRVVCQQLAPTVGQVAANVAMAADAIAGARQAGADVIVLPELVTSGYVFDSMAEAWSSALERGDQVFETLGRAAGERTVLVAGFAERGADGVLYNSAVMLTAGSDARFYRKLHLWDNEKRFFTPGTDRPWVADTAHGRIGVIICYDMEFPELTRYVAQAGADLLAVPTNWPRVERPVGERAPEVVIGMAAARVNRMAIACCDRAGDERGVAWTEATTIISSDGWVVADSATGPTVSADLDLSAGRDKRISPHNDLFDDRRPDLY